MSKVHHRKEKDVDSALKVDIKTFRVVGSSDIVHLANQVYFDGEDKFRLEIHEEFPVTILVNGKLTEGSKKQIADLELGNKFSLYLYILLNDFYNKGLIPGGDYLVEDI